MPAKKITLFVQFDGVLQPWGVKSSQVVFGNIFMELLGSMKNDVEIIVTDRTVMNKRLESIRSYLPGDIASIVSGSVYLSDPNTSVWNEYFSALATRYEIIRVWLERERPASNCWLALEEGAQIDSWPLSERGHVVWGSLGYPNVQREFLQKFSAQVACLSAPDS